MENRVRELNLKRVIHQLEHALIIAEELSWNPGAVHAIAKANAGGIRLLEKLKVIEVSDDHWAIVRK